MWWFPSLPDAEFAFEELREEPSTSSAASLIVSRRGRARARLRGVAAVVVVAGSTREASTGVGARPKVC